MFEHWDDLNALCQRRFPRSENLGHQALVYAVDRLEQDEWKRVCAWQGKSEFRTFLMTLVARLVTDFGRERFGHVRPPRWLAAKTDPIWLKAYRLLLVEEYGRGEALEILALAEPEREPAFIEQVVAAVIGGCANRPRFDEGAVSLDAVSEPADPRSDPQSELDAAPAEIELFLQEYLEAGPGSPRDDPRIEAIRRQLSPHLALDQTDRALVRMRCLEGMKMNAIARALGLQGDPYKRYHRVIRELSAACRAAGLL